MKKKLLLFAVMILSVCVFSTRLFAQDVPGGEAGNPADAIDFNPANPPSEIDFDFGSAGVLSIVSSSPFYPYVVPVLGALHVKIKNGFIVFPTTSCYQSTLQALYYYIKCISYSCYHTACTHVPAGCH